MNWRVLASRGLIFSVIWWTLTNGSASSWWIGAPAVLLATIISTTLLAPKKFSWYKLIIFIPVFLYRSLLGGFEVAEIAFHPKMPLDPDLISYPLSLPTGMPQVVMLNMVSLLPGTLSADLVDSNLRVHVLNRHTDCVRELAVLESEVAAMFDFQLDTAES